MKLNIIVIAVLCLTKVAVIPECPAQNSRSGSDRMVVAANTPGNSTIFDQVRYNPLVVYGGPFSTNAVYFHNPGNPNWRAGLKRDVDGITCRPALDSFRRTGVWSGHLKRDGSCGDTAEPVEWAVGNWLNFNGAKSR